MKKRVIQLAVFTVTILIGATSCNNYNRKDVKDLNQNFSNAVVIADTISYDVTIKNPDPEDTWMEEDLRRVDEEALANIVLDAILDGKLTAYDYQLETPLTIEEVKELETKYSRNKVARMRFVEEWYFDEENLQFGKKVNSIMIAYEKFNNEGQVRYVPGVMVYLNNKSKNP